MDIKTSFDDPLPAPLLKSSLQTLLPHILDLVNLSLSTGDISGLKESVITPILKKAFLDHNIFKNYRPIVTLQFLSKIIEKVVLKRLTHHMTINDLHCPNQFGCKKKIIQQKQCSFKSLMMSSLALKNIPALFWYY